MTRTPVQREATLAAGAAASLATFLVWLGPPGADLAEHAYQRTLFLHSGFALWNNFWYAGRYSFVTYSVLYYPLAALLGIKLLAVATVAAAALAFTLVVWREWGPVAPRPKVNSEFENVGRNDLCPCGSGKKFKKCHGA